uniref:PEP-CTERM system associated protein n=1 Tax=Desulfovibrio sp. U5L TaxID=596152 RepID=I2Q339_9BACT
MRQRFLLFIPVLAFSLLSSGPCRAEFEYRASVSAGQEYNSNVNESSKPKADFITIMSTSVQALYAGPRLNTSVDYQGDLRLYDTGQRQDELLNSLEAKASFQVIKELLLLEVADSNHMVYYNAAKGDTNPADSTEDQVNQNILSGGLTLTPRINDRTTTSLGYRASSSLYDSSDAVNKLTQTAYAEVLHALTPRMDIGGTLQYQFQNTSEGDVSRYMASGVVRYTYGDGCYVFGRFGAVQSVYNAGGNTLLPVASAGLTHTLGRTTFLLQAQADYVDNPSSVYNSYKTLYSATVTRTFERGTVSAYAGYSNYSGQDTNQTNDLTTTVQGTYELTPRLGSTLSLSRIGSVASGDSADRYYLTAEMRYQLPKDASVKLYYQYKRNEAASSGESSYNVNIIGLALSKSF